MGDYQSKTNLNQRSFTEESENHHLNSSRWQCPLQSSLELRMAVVIPKYFNGYMEVVLHYRKLNFLPKVRFKMKIFLAIPKLNLFNQMKDLGKTETNAIKGMALKPHFPHISATIIITHKPQYHTCLRHMISHGPQPWLELRILKDLLVFLFLCIYVCVPHVCSGT